MISAQTSSKSFSKALFQKERQNLITFVKTQLLKPKVVKAALIVAGCYLLAMTLTTYTRLGESASDSLQSFKYALYVKTSVFDRGDIVLIQNHKTAYDDKYRKLKQRGELVFAKRIAGMPGDLITRDKERLCISSRTQKDKPLELTPVCCSHTQAVNDLSNGQSVPLLDQTKDGKPLTPLRATIVPEGYVFIVGDHPRSFDSRYEEFGLVPQEKIWGKSKFTW